MGHILDNPRTKKDAACGRASGRLGLAWASSAMQGWRIGMEDAHITLPELKEERWKGVAMFGVMDGHGGEQVALFSERHLPEQLQAFELASPEGPPTNDDLKGALTEAFHRIDDLLRDRALTGAELQSLTLPPVPGDRYRYQRGSVDPHAVGCTCVISCITETHFVVANAGDSRAVLCRAGKAVPLSEDHKPSDPGERSRIVAAGGYIESSSGQPRVNGNLNLSRALGDLEYKRDRRRGPEQQIISATPDVSVTERSAEDEFLLICCDGVWDLKTSQQAVDFVRRRLPKGAGATPEAMVQVMGELLDDCLSPDLRTTRGLGGDNMTAVIVRLPPPPGASEAQEEDEDHEVRLVAVRCHERSPTDGFLRVRLEMPKACGGGDMRLDMCKRTGELDVCVAGGPGHRFSLLADLPPGAELAPVVEAAKFHRKSRTVRCRLPWRLPSQAG